MKFSLSREMTKKPSFIMENLILDTVETNHKETIKKIQDLAPFVKDYIETFSLKPFSYHYLQFEGGYGIVKDGNILEIGEGYLFKKGKENYYLGYGAYYQKSNGQFFHLLTDKKCSFPYVAFYQKELLNRLKGILELPRNLVKRPKVYPDEPDSFIGVKEEQMKRYEKWITAENNLCGTYASVVLFSYLQDTNQLVIPTVLRKKDSLEYMPLFKQVKKRVQPLAIPTVPIQIAYGWRRFFKSYHIQTKILCQSFGGQATLKELLKQKQPALLGVLTVFGSSYGNHWVVPHSYREYQGVTYYKIHDNWGNYRKIIPATLGNGVVSVKKRTP